MSQQDITHSGNVSLAHLIMRVLVLRFALCEPALSPPSGRSKAPLIILVAIAVAAIGFSSISFAEQRAATDVETKAIYCIGVQDFWLRTVMDVKTENPQVEEVRKKILKETMDTANRMNAYLFPRMSEIDINGLTRAIKRAEADTYGTVLDERLFLKQTSECFNKCPQKGDVSRCVKQAKACIPKELMERIESCTNLNWLPF